MKVFNKKLWEILSIVFAVLLVVFVAVNSAGTIMEGQLNEMLGLRNYKEIGGDPNEDTDYFKQLKTSADIEEYYRDVNVKVEEEGLVLLKNDGALPLDTGSKVSLALSGSAKIFYATHGPGVRVVHPEEFVSLKAALEEDGELTVNPDLYAYYETGAGKATRGKMKTADGRTLFRTNEKSWNDIPSNLRSLSDYGDAAIAVITRESGEGDDVSASGSDGADGSYLSLTASEVSVLEALAAKKESGEVKKIIVLINSAVTLQCDFLFDDTLAIDAAMWIGLPGGTGTRGVARALVGKVNPSGRLSDTFLKDNFSAPSAAYWKVNEGFASTYTNASDMSLNATQQYYGVYVENIYVGYRYFETRYEDYVLGRANVGDYDYSKEVAYPFGYGMSYTSFTYDSMTVSALGADGNYTVDVTVRNSGAVKGREVVQIYVQKPYSKYDQTFGIEKASVELAGFAKTAEIAPGATETVHIKVAKELFKSYDSEIAETYILDEGDYYLAAGKDAHDAVNNILMLKAANGEEVNTENMIGEGKASLAKVVWSNGVLDTTTYAKSAETGADITNQLDFMDPNRYAGVTNTAKTNGKVTYLSRYNWTGTFPSEKTLLALTDKGSVKYDITSHKALVEDEGAEMPTYGASNGLTLAMMRGKKYDDDDWNKLLDEIKEDEMWLFLTGCYGYTPAVQSIAKPLTDEDDGPYGVSNCDDGYSSMSCEGIIAATFDEKIFTLVGEAIAADARSEYGGTQKKLHGLYAPGINVHRVAFGGRASEYFSEDPVLSGMAALYEIKAMQAQGVIAHPKHYIFNDEESQRNGICVWSNEQAAREIYLLPWEYAVRPSMGNAHALMTSFNRAGCIWTSASDGLMENILRGEWAFDGYALTDMAESNGGYFMTYDDGFMNGTDCFLGRGTDTWQSSWKQSPTFNQNLRESAHRMLYVFANYSAAMNGISSSTRIVSVLVWWRLLIILVVVLFAVLTAGSVAMYVLSELKSRKSKNE